MIDHFVVPEPEMLFDIILSILNTFVPQVVFQLNYSSAAFQQLTCTGVFERIKLVMFRQFKAIPN